MQKITYYCDKCGKEITMRRFRLEIVDIDTDTAASSFDLCEPCQEELRSSIALPPPLAKKRKR